MVSKPCRNLAEVSRSSLGRWESWQMLVEGLPVTQKVDVSSRKSSRMHRKLIKGLLAAWKVDERVRRVSQPNGKLMEVYKRSP